MAAPVLNPLNGLSNWVPSQQPFKVGSTMIPVTEMRKWLSYYSLQTVSGIEFKSRSWVHALNC